MRSVDPAITAATVSPTIKGIYFVLLCFDTQSVAWHSGFGNIILDGITYLGLGHLGSIGQIHEETGIKSSGVSVGVSGIKQEVVGMLLGQAYLNRKAYIYFVPVDDSNRPIVASPYLLFRGTMDSIDGQMGAGAGFTVTLKSRLADWERPRKCLYTDVEQQRLYPEDLGMEFIAQLSQKKIIWPRAAFLPDPRN